MHVTFFAYYKGFIHDIVQILTVHGGHCAKYLPKVTGDRGLLYLSGDELEGNIVDPWHPVNEGQYFAQFPD